ncbi:MAG: DNA polymerase III subunit chi [Micavibrio sp.]|nr:DNA polymerase III subunit chi [Micavibrio sp.]
MAEVKFYHMERSGLDEVLPKLLTTVLNKGYRIHVRCPHDKEAARLNDHLWSFDARSFLPHGIAKDGAPENQPIYLSAEEENPNGANVLFLTGGARVEDITPYEIICALFNGHDPEAVSDARRDWKEYKDAGLDVTYWQQGERGWEKKA